MIHQVVHIVWWYAHNVCFPAYQGGIAHSTLPAACAMNKRKFEEPKASSVEAHLVSCSPFEPQYEPEDARIKVLSTSWTERIWKDVEVEKDVYMFWCLFFLAGCIILEWLSSGDELVCRLCRKVARSHDELSVIGECVLQKGCRGCHRSFPDSKFTGIWIFVLVCNSKDLYQ